MSIVTTTKYYHLGGTIRTCLPEATLSNLSSILPTIGITRVANVTHLDSIGIPVALCIRPNAKHLSVSQGKGLTWELAKISAIMESIEGYHAENPIPPDLHGSYETLCQNYLLINPEQMMTGYFPDKQIKQRELTWIKGKEILTNTTLYIPHTMICLDSSQNHPEYAVFSVNSNGLAAGNSLEEAMLHALYEIIERDALWFFATLDEVQQTMRLVRQDTIDSAINQQLLLKFQQANMSVSIWNLTGELGIPAYSCAITETNSLRSLGTFTGSGAHLSHEIALARALTEAAQTRLTLITGSRDDIYPEYYQQLSKQKNHVSNIAANAHFGINNQKLISDTLDAQLHTIKQRLKQRGYQKIITINHTKPQLNIPVVHLFVPGMQCPEDL